MRRIALVSRSLSVLFAVAGLGCGDDGGSSSASAGDASGTADESGTADAGTDDQGDATADDGSATSTASGDGDGGSGSATTGDGSAGTGADGGSTGTGTGTGSATTATTGTATTTATTGTATTGGTGASSGGVTTGVTTGASSGGTTGASSGGTTGVTSSGTTGGTAGTTAGGTTGTTGMGTTGGTTGGVCDPGPGVIDFSYIWIANSTQGTVSKIDTRTTVEEGRYYVGDYAGAGPSDCQGPSRTSVNLDGDVAVLDRGGGVAKIYADPADCPDTNGNNMADTSNGSTPLAWSTDECLAWDVDIPVQYSRGSNPSCNGPRTVQWTAPDDLGNCMLGDPRVWVAFCNDPDDDVTVWLLDGADGSNVATIPITGYGCSTYGPYGGVVDANNNLWFVDRNASRDLYRVDYNCTPNPGMGITCFQQFTRPNSNMRGYGITIDPDGKIWMAGDNNSLFNYDPMAVAWTNYKSDLDTFFSTVAPPDSNTDNTLRGLMVDENGIIWVASIAAGAWGGGSNPGLLKVDPTMNPVDFEFFGPSTLTGIQHSAGISIDVEGYVWLVDTRGDQAYKIDPDTPSTNWVVTGLQYPYTYSDMTGFALRAVTPG